MSDPSTDAAAKPVETRPPREESRPVEHLTPDQEEAALELHKFLCNLAQRSQNLTQDARGQLGFLPEIIKDRPNRVFLIEGGRGSGKSALLITMIDEWASALTNKTPGARWPIEGLVPLLFDLHPIPASTHLLLHLVGQLSQVVQWVEQQDGRGGGLDERPPWHLGEAAESGSAKQWRNLLKAAALGWDGALRSERKSGEIESYIVELEEIERNRLRLKHTFRSFLDALVRDLRTPRGLNKHPFFLICIDDADMTPERTLEVLDLCRMLEHSHLAFLLTGQDSLFEVALRAHILGTLRRPLGGLHFSQNEQLALGDIAESARLAIEFYGKIIPPPQRLRLRPLQPQQRLDGIGERRNPSGGSPAAPQIVGSVRDLLAKLTEGSASGRHLASLLDRNPTLRYALPDRLRALIDFCTFLESLRTKPRDGLAASEKGSDAAKVLEYLWNHALDRSVLPADIRERLRTAVRPSHSAHGVVVSSGDLTLDFVLQGRILREDEFCAGFRLWAAEPFWSLQVIDKEQSLRQTESALAALMLSVDFALADVVESRLRLHLPALPADCHPVFVRFLENYTIAWPVPDWRGFTDLMGLARRWRDLAPRPPDEAPHLLKRYLGLVLNMIEAPEKREDDPGALELSDLARRCHQIIEGGTKEKNDSARHRAAVKWAQYGAPLLAAPEYGLPAELANEWLTLLMRAMPEERTQHLANARRERLRQALRAQTGRGVIVDTELTQLIAELDRTTDHSWGRIIEGLSPRRSLEDLLREFPVQRPTAPSVPGPGNILGYCHGNHRQRWLREMGAKASDEISSWLQGAQRLNTSGRDAILLIWKVLTKELPRRLQLEELVRWETHSTGTYLYVHVDYRRRLEEMTRFALTLPDGRQVVPRRVAIAAKDESLPPWLEGFLRVAYDVAWDEEDGKGEPGTDDSLNPFRPWWRGISVRVSDIVNDRELGFTWPAPSWPALLDWELLYEAWPSWVLAATGAPAGERIDQLAYAYCVAMRDLFESRQVSARALAAFEQRYADGLPWHALANHLLGFAQNHERHRSELQRSRRAYYYAAWCHAFLLLAAPESGLTQDAATKILEVIPVNDDGKLWEVVSALRRDRAAYQLDIHAAKRTVTQERRITAMLAAIDAELPGHPWVKWHKKNSAKPVRKPKKPA